MRGSSLLLLALAGCGDRDKGDGEHADSPAPEYDPYAWCEAVYDAPLTVLDWVTGEPSAFAHVTLYESYYGTGYLDPDFHVGHVIAEADTDADGVAMFQLLPCTVFDWRVDGADGGSTMGAGEMGVVRDSEGVPFAGGGRTLYSLAAGTADTWLATLGVTPNLGDGVLFGTCLDDPGEPLSAATVVIYDGYFVPKGRVFYFAGDPPQPSPAASSTDASGRWLALISEPRSSPQFAIASSGQMTVAIAAWDAAGSVSIGPDYNAGISRCRGCP